MNNLESVLTYEGTHEIHTLVVGASAHRRERVPLVLALPVLELGAGPAEEDPLPGDATRTDLSAVRVLDDVGREQRREHEDANRGVRAVRDLVVPIFTAAEADNVSLRELPLAFVRRSVGRPRTTTSHSSFA